MPVPLFNVEGNDFWAIFRKDRYNEQSLRESGLNERQIKAVLYVKAKGRITNGEYQNINECSRNTASSELNDLVNKSILQSSDVKGAGAFYQLCAIAQ